MTRAIARSSAMARSFATDDERWRAVSNRDPASDGVFIYSVKTTGVYCRPTCPSRLAKRENVRFHATCAEAERAGFRACKRCQPAGASAAERQVEVVARACRMIEAAEQAPALEELATTLGLSAAHFHRLFKAQTGVTPKAYASAQRASRVRQELASGQPVTRALYRAGYASNGAFHASSQKVLGMQPKAVRAGGRGETIRFAIGQCWLGSILVAATEKGICAILLGDDPEELIRDLQNRFRRAELIGGDAKFEKLVARVVGFVEQPAKASKLPLDIRGTAFQQQVWQALLKIPAGTTVSYAEIARRIGRPGSVRAVGQAIGANPIAVAIPCHRVVRTDGSLCGYHWGVERKIELQERERQRTKGK